MNKIFRGCWHWYRSILILCQITYNSVHDCYGNYGCYSICTLYHSAEL